MSRSRVETIASIYAYPGTVGILSTGQDPKTMKDLLAFGQEERATYLKGLQEYLSTQATSSYTCDDALVLKEPQIGIAYYQEGALLKNIDSLVKGETVDPIVKPWSTGPWLPEAFADDLRRAKAMHGADKIYSALRVFDKYPEGLSEAICASTALEMNIKLKRLSESKEESLSSSILAADICIAGLRYLHATHKVYFRGLRYSDTTIPHLPAVDQALATKLNQSSENHLLAETLIG